MRTRRKAILLDLDGTLLNSDRTVSSRDTEMVRRYADNGHLIVIATARPLRTALTALPMALREGYLVTFNGAWIFRGEEMIHRREIPSAQVLRVVEALHAHGFQPAIEAADRLYTDINSPPGSNWERLPLAEYPQVAACKVPAQGHRRIDESLISRIIPEDLEFVIIDGGTLLQVARRGCSKASACEVVLDREGIDPVDAVAFGDDVNDIPMFELAGFSVAMGNAVRQVKTAADAVTLSNDADGVAHGLARYVPAMEHSLKDE